MLVVSSGRQRRTWSVIAPSLSKSKVIVKTVFSEKGNSVVTLLVRAMSQRSEPLSIETLLQKQREEKEAASKVMVILFSCP